MKTQIIIVISILSVAFSAIFDRKNKLKLDSILTKLHKHSEENKENYKTNFEGNAFEERAKFYKEPDIFRNEGDIFKSTDDISRHESEIQYGTKTTGDNVNKENNNHSGLGTNRFGVNLIDEEKTEVRRVKRENGMLIIVDNCPGKQVYKIHNGDLFCAEDDGGPDVIDVVRNGIGSACASHQIKALFRGQVTCVNKAKNKRNSGLGTNKIGADLVDGEKTEVRRVRRQREMLILVDSCPGKQVYKCYNGDLFCTEDDGGPYIIDVDNRNDFGPVGCPSHQKKVLFRGRVTCVNKERNKRNSGGTSKIGADLVDGEKTKARRVKGEKPILVITDNCRDGKLVHKIDNGHVYCTEDDGGPYLIDVDTININAACASTQRKVILRGQVTCIYIENDKPNSGGTSKIGADFVDREKTKARRVKRQGAMLIIMDDCPGKQVYKCYYGDLFCTEDDGGPYIIDVDNRNDFGSVGCPSHQKKVLFRGKETCINKKRGKKGGKRG